MEYGLLSEIKIASTSAARLRRYAGSRMTTHPSCEQWNKATRAAMPGAYDAIWQDGFWKGVGVALAVCLAAWLLVMLRGS